MGEATSIGKLAGRRYWSDRITRWVIAAGGAAVIGAITLIFAYLLWVVAPILLPGSIDAAETFKVSERDALLVDVSENGEVLLRLSADGIVEFYDSESGRGIAGYDLGTTLTRAQRVYPTVDLYALGTAEGKLIFLQTRYTVSFTDGVRKLTPRIEYPYPDTDISLPPGAAMDVHLDDLGNLVVASATAAEVNVLRYRNAEMGYPLPAPRALTIDAGSDTRKIMLGARNEWIYIIGQQADVQVFSLLGSDAGDLLVARDLANDRVAVNAVLGRYSLLVANPGSGLTQWGLFKDTQGYALKPMRSFESTGEVQRFIIEPRRKGFGALTDAGMFELYYPTSERYIDSAPTPLTARNPGVISPRSNRLVGAPDSTTLIAHGLSNKHPEISLSALWAKVWYEGYEEPVYSWQSSSADNDFEPKFSLTPLAFGTLKAAFYALLFAVPIAIMGALYTAYFMSPAMRAWVKPGIEIMAALPTVILGFIGGLWLAPIIEANLSSVLGIMVVMPVLLFVLALGWTFLPDKVARPFSGWYGLLVTPLIVLTVYLAFDVGPFLEDQFFGGDSKAWFREVLGLPYDQRNALVVGIIMGLAVIPVIFSIAEDAIYGVPQHLINGSLALGATPWQTLVRVVLLTASPGIFSAVMIGMGRAVGETMIVLMATGNTPLMDWNIFEGMRTFAANIAVELPEAEVDSSHYRILFLAALVLFMLTFVFNTLAEVVRQRLRNRYGSL